MYSSINRNTSALDIIRIAIITQVSQIKVSSRLGQGQKIFKHISVSKNIIPNTELFVGMKLSLNHGRNREF